MEKIIIDGDGAVFGRLCSFIAKKALEGNEIAVINCDKVIITGSKKNIIEKYKILRKKGGHSQKGPKHSKLTYRILKRGIRNMLPDFRRGQGKQAFSRIKCYEEVPKEFENAKVIKSGKTKPNKYIELKELSQKI